MAMNYQIKQSENYVCIDFSTGQYWFTKDQYEELWHEMVKTNPDGMETHLIYRLNEWTRKEWNFITDQANEAVAEAAIFLEMES